MKLEYLAGYLPYELEAIDTQTKEIRIVTLLHFTYDLKTVGHNHLIYEGLILRKHKPMLLNPINITKEIADDFYTGTEPYDSFRVTYLTIIYKYDNLSIWRVVDMCNGIDNIDKMNKHHIDYRGLIEKGLAIDK
jgi:hypothetical protein